jgi:hypothetical protein
MHLPVVRRHAPLEAYEIPPPVRVSRASTTTRLWPTSPWLSSIRVPMMARFFFRIGAS